MMRNLLQRVAGLFSSRIESRQTAQFLIPPDANQELRNDNLVYTFGDYIEHGWAITLNSTNDGNHTFQLIHPTGAVCQDYFLEVQDATDADNTSPGTIRTQDFLIFNETDPSLIVGTVTEVVTAYEGTTATVLFTTTAVVTATNVPLTATSAITGRTIGIVVPAWTPVSVTPTPSATANPPVGLSSSEKVGLGVGIGLGIPILVGVGILVWALLIRPGSRRRRLPVDTHDSYGIAMGYQDDVPGMHEGVPHPGPAPGYPKDRSDLDGHRLSELDSERPMGELAENRAAHQS